MFEQVLDPILGSLAVSAAVAALPLAALFILLGVFKMKAAYASLVSLAVAMALAVFGWRMPVTQLLSATAEGAFYGLFPILWILVNALWIYKLTVVTGWFEVLGRTIRAISPDLRILSILVAFCFGALLESLAGFGAPVAISAAMLLAAGMKPIRAAVVSLLANTAPVAFGAMAAPIITLSGVTGLPIEDLAAMAGRQTPFVAILIPLVLVFVVDGKRGVRQTWPVALVAGFVFGLAQFVTSNYFAVELTDVVAAVATVAAVLVMLRFWQPKEIVGLGFDGDVVVQTRAEAATAESIRSGIAPRRTGTVGGAVAVATATAASGVPVAQRTGPRSVWMALAPYLAIMAIFSVAQIPAAKTWLAEVGSVVFQWPGLDVVDASGAPAPAMTFKLDHLKATGTLLLFSGIVTMALYRVGLRDAVRAYRDTIVQLKWTIVTVTVVLALSFVMNLSGQTASLGFGLAATGGLFVLLSPVIGWFGVALTGSDTSSNSLFGLLQVTAARQVGLDPVLMAAANSSAGVLGKMLSVQNLAVAAAAVGMVGSEGELFRKLIGWSLGLPAFPTINSLLQSGPALGLMGP